MIERRRFLKSLSFLAATMAYAGRNSSASPSEMAAFSRNLQSATPLAEKYWRLIKDQFLLPKDYTYFNTGGLGATPYVVVEKVKEFTTRSATYPSPSHDMQEWNRIKAKCAALFSPNCKKEEIALTGSTTEGINIILNGLGLKRGDEVITSTHEHAALNVPLLNQMQRDGITIKSFQPDFKNGLNNVNKIEHLISKRTKLIFFSHITCTTGQLFPVKEIGELARAKGVLFALDGAQVMGNMPVNVNEYGCDFYATCGHKWLLGPQRTGILYVREEMIERLRPTTVGGYSDVKHDIVKGILKFAPGAARYEYATQNIALYFGLEAALDFLKIIGGQSIWQHNKSLAEKLYSGLQDIPNVILLSPEEEKFRTSLITFKLKNIDFRKAGSYLTGEKRIRVRVVPEANVNGIRISTHLYNDESQVEHLLTEVKNLAKM